LQPTRAKTLLLAFFWALSLAAFCVALSVPAAADDTAAVGWTRTMPYTGIWLAAAVALGLGYHMLSRLRRALLRPRLWILAVFLAAVATLGESFAQAGTAELVTDQPWTALLYFAGRVPAVYMGMALLEEALLRRRVPAWPEEGTGAAAAAQQPRPAWLAGVNRKNGAKRKNAAAPYTPPLPEWVAKSRQASWGPDDRGADPTAYSTDSVPALVKSQSAGVQAARQQPEEEARPGETPVKASEPYRRKPADTARGAWAYRNAAGAEEFTLPPSARREGLPVWGFMLILLACWLPYLITVWPGTVSNDSITQLAMIFGRKTLSNGNPLAQTGLLWLAVQAGKGLLGSADAAVALYVCVQAALMAWLLAYTLRRMTDTLAPVWLTVLATAFYALCPVFPVFAFCVGKDTLFAMAVLWFMLMVWRVSNSKWPSFGAALGLCLSAVFCALLRNAGAALAGITLLVLLIRTFTVRTRQWRAPLAALLATGAALAALYLAVIPALGVEPALETENWSVPLQQVARTVASETLTEEERAAVDAVMPVDEIKAAYNGELSDPVKKLWRDTATDEEKSLFFAAWLKLGTEYPATYASAFFHNTYGYLLPGYVSTIKPTFLLGMEGRTTLINGVFDFTVRDAANDLKETLKSLFAYVPFRLLCAPGLYGWLALFALAGIMGCRRRWNAIALLPAVIALAGCLFSAVNGYFRYAMPLYFAVPPMLALLSQALASGRRTGRKQAK